MDSHDLQKRMADVIFSSRMGGKNVTVRIGTFNFEITEFNWCHDCQEFHIEVETEKDCYDKRTASLRDNQGRLRLVREH